MIQVKAPDGSIVQFPVGTDDATITRVMSQAFPAPQRADARTPGSRAQNTILQGMTFGLSDEVGAAGTAAGQFLRSTLREGRGIRDAASDAGRAYDQALGRERASVAQFKEDNPVAGTALEIGGGFLGAAPRLAANATVDLVRAAVPATTLGAAGQSARAGATGGAIAGFGSAEGGLENRLEGTALGAGLGGAIGGSVPLVANAVGRVGGRVLDAVGLRNPQTGGDRQLLRAFERDAAGGGPSLEDVAAAMRANTRQNALPESIPDVSGENVKRLAAMTTQTPGAARQRAQTFLQERAEAQGTRLYDKVNRALAPDEYYQAEGKFLDTLRNNANQFYDEARAATPYVWSRDLDALLQRPTMREALGGAMRKAADEGQPFGVGRRGGQFMRLEDFDKGERIESLTLDAVDRIKRALDQRIETAGKNQFTGRLNDDGRIWTNLKNQFLDAVGKADKSGKYAAARAQYAGDAEVVQALRDGREFMTLDPEQVTAQLRGMSAAERDAFRSGVARAIKDKIDSVRDGADATRQIFGNSAIRAKIEAAFDDPKAFARFEAFMKRERNMAETRNQVGPRAGSPTARNQADMGDAMIDPPGGVLSALMTGNLGAAARAGIEGTMRRAQGMNSATADYLGPILFNSRQEENAAQLARLLAARQQGQRQLANNQALARALLGGAGIATGAQTD